MHKRIKRHSFNIFESLISWLITITLLVTLIGGIGIYISIGLAYKINYNSDIIPIQYSGYGIVNISNINNTEIDYNKLKLLIPKNTNLIIYSGGFTDDKGECSNTISILNKLNEEIKVVYVLQDRDINYKDSIINNTTCEYINEKVITLDVEGIDTERFIHNYCDKAVEKHIKNKVTGAELYKEYIDYKIESDKQKKIVVMGLDGFEDNDYDTKSKLLNSIDTYDNNITKILVIGNMNKLEVIKDVNIDIIFTSSDDKVNKQAVNYSKSTIFTSSGVKNKWNKGLNYRIQYIKLSTNDAINKTLLERLFDLISNNSSNSYESIEEVIEFKENYKN